MSDFGGYYSRNTESGLWTVGFDHPRTGRWEPESDHNSERDAKRRAWELNGVEKRYAYLRSEPELWTVGDCSYGTWCAVSDHGSAQGAADEVIRFNS